MRVVEDFKDEISIQNQSIKIKENIDNVQSKIRKEPKVSFPEINSGSQRGNKSIRFEEESKEMTGSS